MLSISSSCLATTTNWILNFSFAYFELPVSCGHEDEALANATNRYKAVGRNNQPFDTESKIQELKNLTVTQDCL